VNKILTKPLSKRGLKKIADPDGFIGVDVAIDLATLIDCGGIGELNDIMDELVLAESIIGSLSNISYEVEGCIPGSPEGTVTGSIIIHVRADISDILTNEDFLN
jgi:hypothetical protein